MKKMRYMVAQYLHEHPGKLPLGDEPTIRDATWGISYAYYPILSYMVSAVFMGIAGLFHASADGLLHAARMADVLFVTGAVYFVVKASGKLFPKEGRWLFAALAGFMPQALFLGTYVNTDSLALLSMAMILYSWSCYLEAGDWSFRNSILLAVGMAVCALSYYNTYGMDLMQLPVFLPDSPSVQGRAGKTESCISVPERDRDRGSNPCFMRLVVYTKCRSL